jgi:hypothetical protein
MAFQLIIILHLTMIKYLHFIKYQLSGDIVLTEIEEGGIKNYLVF